MHVDETSKDTLWTLFAGPTVWAFHFLFSYVTAAVYCAKAGGGAVELMPARLWVAGYTVVALLILLGLFAYAWRQWRFGDFEPPHDSDTPADRRRFLGYSTLLLCGLSFVAVIYGAMPALLTETCR